MRFRLVTYNIHKAIGGVDRRYRPERVVETLVHYAPDIIFLQEVDEGVPRSRKHRQVDLLGDALELPHRAFQPNVRLKQGRYGNAILSRFPLHDIHDIDLTVPLKKRRRALSAHCRLHVDDHQRTLLLMNCHLGLAGFERTIQVRRMLESRPLGRTHRSTPVIVAGDYNDAWGRLGRRFLLAGFRCGGKFRSFPAVMPVRPLDRIYFRGAMDLHHSFAGHNEMARQASDHLPIVADFDVLPPE